MKRSPITLVTGAVLVLIFGMLLFTFQVRQTDVAVVTTFGNYARTITEPGLYGKWPWPVQRVYKFDNRLRSFETPLEQSTTRDGRILLVSAYVGWRIADPRLFLERFNHGDLTRAGQTLEGQVRDTKSSVVARYTFANFISTNATELKFDEIEGAMLDNLQRTARESYGIEVRFAGLKQIGLPESITTTVFKHMVGERERLIKQLTGEGDSEAIRIRAETARKRTEVLSKAEAQATVLRGQAEADAAKSLAVFEQDPKLANFLLELRALETSLKDRATLILDQQTPPFNLLREGMQPPLPPKR